MSLDRKFGGSGTTVTGNDGTQSGLEPLACDFIRSLFRDDISWILDLLQVNIVRNPNVKLDHLIKLVTNEV